MNRGRTSKRKTTWTASDAANTLHARHSTISRANAARLLAVVILSGCTTGLVPPPSEGLELTCDAAQLRIAWSVPARLASIEVIGPHGIPLMDEALEVPPGQPAEPFESTYEWPRNVVTPSGDYNVTFVVDGRQTEHVVTCP